MAAGGRPTCVEELPGKDWRNGQEAGGTAAPTGVPVSVAAGAPAVLAGPTQPQGDAALTLAVPLCTGALFADEVSGTVVVEVLVCGSVVGVDVTFDVVAAAFSALWGVRTDLPATGAAATTTCGAGAGVGAPTIGASNTVAGAMTVAAAVARKLATATLLGSAQRPASDAKVVSACPVGLASVWVTTCVTPNPELDVEPGTNGRVDSVV